MAARIVISARIIFPVLLFMGASYVLAQDKEKSPPPIQDNSFLLEEAYNQEAGVVQHINTFSRSWTTRQWIYTFTEEWPVPGHARNQLSYTFAALTADPGICQGAGAGDVAFNYRYQVLGGGESKLSFAPRISALIPSGDYRRGHGYGGTGIQINLPVSLVLGRQLVTHLNAGTTLVPSARNALGDKAFTNAYNAGQSLVWLARPNFNLLFETTWMGFENVIGRGSTQRSHDLLLAPGARWAINLARGLQIVPGISVPVGVGPGAGEKSLFLYLSFEHPLWKEKSR
ncbi:MAG TPA: transporter [Candidatus Angelobacter sp.]|nr:transporter [Candidatus Angelobacter sp.]